MKAIKEQQKGSVNVVASIKHHYLEASSQKSREKEKENDRNKQKSLDSPMGLFFSCV